MSAWHIYSKHIYIYSRIKIYLWCFIKDTVMKGELKKWPVWRVREEDNTH